jgi:hypothetical protein
LKLLFITNSCRFKEEATKVRFFSLLTHEYVHELTFNSEVDQIASNPNILVITDDTNISWFNPLTMQRIVCYNCYPIPQPDENEINGTDTRSMPQLGVIALGTRWIAYPSISIVTNKNFDYTQQSNQTYTEISMDVAKKLASTTMYLGDLGYKAVSSYINPDNVDTRPTAPISKNYGKDAGTVELRDIKTKRLIAHFRAHAEPIAAMTFDPSGTLLVTVSVKGTYLNVYQIMPNHNSKVGSKNIRHIYRLLRGYTNAKIHNIQFSINSKWISVCSGNGTTHLFAINPTGGPVDPIDFVSTLYDSRVRVDYDALSTVVPEEPHEKGPITLYAVNRIHGASSFFYSGQLVEPTGSMSSTFYPVEKKTCESLLVATISGQFCHYRLEPFIREVEPTTTSKLVKNVINGATVDAVEKKFSLALQITLMSKQDCCRSTNQTSREVQLKWDIAPLYPTIVDEEYMRSRWISNAEIDTYRIPNMPIWTTGQFKFKTYGDETKEEDTRPLHRVTFVDDMAKSVFIRVGDPIPVRNGTTEEDHEKDPMPPVRDGGILKAIATPMGQKSVHKTEWDMVDDIIPPVHSVGLKREELDSDDEEEEKIVPHNITFNQRFVSSPEVSPNGKVTSVDIKEKPKKLDLDDYFSDDNAFHDIEAMKPVDLSNKKKEVSKRVEPEPAKHYDVDSESDTEIESPLPPKVKEEEKKQDKMSLSSLIIKDDYLSRPPVDERVLNESYVNRLLNAHNAVASTPTTPEETPVTKVVPERTAPVSSPFKPPSMISGLLSMAPPSKPQQQAKQKSPFQSMTSSLLHANYDYMDKGDKEDKEDNLVDAKSEDESGDDYDKEENRARKALLRDSMFADARRHDSDSESEPDSD